MKFGNYTNSYMQISMAIFIISMVISPSSVFNQKYPFCENLIPMFKIVCFKWNLVITLIRICRIQWWHPLFMVFNRKYSFWAKLVQKKSKLLVFTLKFGTKIPFLGKFNPMLKIVWFKRNLITTLIRICRIQWLCLLNPFFDCHIG